MRDSEERRDIWETLGPETTPRGGETDKTMQEKPRHIMIEWGRMSTDTHVEHSFMNRYLEASICSGLRLVTPPFKKCSSFAMERQCIRKDYISYTLRKP